MKTIRIGIAGLGRMGKSHALNLARHTEGAALVGACSPVAAELDWAADAGAWHRLPRRFNRVVASARHRRGQKRSLTRMQ